MIGDQSTVSLDAKLLLPIRESVVSSHYLHTQRLGLCSRPKLRRNRADRKRLKAEVKENRANFEDTQRRLIELQVNDIVICVHLVPQSGHLCEVPVRSRILPTSRKSRA